MALDFSDINLDDLNEDNFPVLDPAEVDALPEEEANLYFDDPVAFFKQKAGAAGAATHEHDDGEDDDASPEPNGEDGHDGEDGHADGEEVEFANPYREQGIPDYLLMDEDGNPYANGLIMGKYESADEYHKGMREAQKLIGRRSTVADEEFTPPVGSIPVTLSPDQRSYVDAFALSNALQRHAEDFRNAGLDPEDYLEDFESLRGVSDELYYEVRRTRRDIAKESENYVQNYMQTLELRPAMNEHNANRGYALFEQEFITATGGIEPDDDDREVLMGKYEETLGQVQAFDEQVQAAIAANPQADPYSNPQIRQFYIDFFDNANGVFVLSPQKVASAALAANRDTLFEAVRNTASGQVVGKYKTAMEREAEQTLPPVRTATTAGSDGVTGGHRPVWPLEKLLQPGAMDTLVKEHGGDEKKAMEEYDRMIDYHDQQAMAPASRKRVPAGQRSF